MHKFLNAKSFSFAHVSLPVSCSILLATINHDASTAAFSSQSRMTAKSFWKLLTSGQHVWARIDCHIQN